MRRLLWLGVVVTLSACDALRDAFSARAEVAARAGGESLGVEQLARWAGLGKQVPMQQEALYRLSKVWVDFTLFAQAIASERPLTDSATVAVALWPFFAQAKWERLHDRLVNTQFDLTPAQVDSAYNAGYARLFQHILLQVPPSAAADVQDRKRRDIESLRRQTVARNGRNFTQLAVQYSEDAATKDQGGFLGIFEIGDPFVQEFKDAAWALAPGAISPVVRTAYGFHVIRRPLLSDVPDVYRSALTDRLTSRFDSILIDSLAAARHARVASGALAAARQTVQDLDVSRGGDRVLVRYDGGAFRVGDLVRWVYSLEPQVAQAIATVPDEQLQQFLRLLAQRQILLTMADSAGIQPTDEDWAFARAQHDSAIAVLRALLRLTPDVVRDSAVTSDGRRRLASTRVSEYLDRVVQGRAQFLPMPPFFSVALREGASWHIDPAALRLALDRARALRATSDSTRPAAPPPGLTPAPGPPPVPNGGGPQ
jgi:hypothetical protein